MELPQGGQLLCCAVFSGGTVAVLCTFKELVGMDVSSRWCQRRYTNDLFKKGYSATLILETAIKARDHKEVGVEGDNLPIQAT